MLFSIPSINEIIEKSVQTFKRFPFVLISSFIVTGISLYFIQVEPAVLQGIYLVLAKIALSAMLGGFVFTAVRLLGNVLSTRLHWFITLLAFAGLLLYYVILPNEATALEGIIVFFRHSFLLLLFFIAILWTPFIKSNLNNGDYWEYAKHMFFSLVMTIIFTVVMVLGINGAVFAVEKLFELSIKGKFYGQIDVFILGVFSVGYFLSQIPEKPLFSKRSKQQPGVEKFFTKWILTPLSGLYFIILYAYTFKVLITMNWPKGILAWLIVIFSIVAILTYLFWTHFVEEENRGWRRWIWLAVLLQTMMLFAAIGMRIAEYSWTESRYMVFILGIWLAGVSLYFLLFKNARIKWIFVSLSLAVALTQFGPFNAYSVSKHAQIQRLKGMISELETHEDKTKLPLKLRYEISDVLEYLDKRYRGESLATIFPNITEEFNAMMKEIGDCSERKKLSRESSEKYKDKPNRLTEYITDALGFTYISRWEYEQEKNPNYKDAFFSMKKVIYPQQRAIDVKGYDYMTHFYGNYSPFVQSIKRTSKSTLENTDIDIEYNNYQLIIHRSGQPITFYLEPYVEALIKKYGNKRVTLSLKELTLVKENDNLKVKLEMEDIDKRVYKDKTSINFSVNIFFKVKE